MTKKSMNREHSRERSLALPQQRAIAPPNKAEPATSNNKSTQVPAKASSSDQSKPATKKRGTSKNSVIRPTTKAGKKTAPKKKKSARKKKKLHPLSLRIFLIALETGALLTAGVAILMVLFGYGSEYLTGTSFFYNLLPFAFAALLIVLAGTLLVRIWRYLRSRLKRWHLALPSLFALILASSACLLIQGQHFARPLAQFRLLVGGTAEMRTLTLKHQIYAAYRRLDANEVGKMLVRAQIYAPDIVDAARIFGIDADLLNGLAATESSFYPRTSTDGGQGLFQITSIPVQAQKQALEHLGSNTTDMALHRHNTFAAAATLRYYLKQMSGDMVLALLAYNIGPANGGLRHIMERYSATDFITIQPYLQEKPRNYPVRVLSYALAFRINRVEQQLLPYEDGLNAIRIQHIGIPGL